MVDTIPGSEGQTQTVSSPGVLHRKANPVAVWRNAGMARERLKPRLHWGGGVGAGSPQTGQGGVYLNAAAALPHSIWS